MNERILIVEDEKELCMMLGDRLSSEGYLVDFAFDGATGLQKITSATFDLIILDIMLPAKSGLELCAHIRQSGMGTPILVLTALSQTIEKVAGLKLGADDYVTKPFDTLELMARIEALLRRATQQAAASPATTPDVVRVGSLVLDLRRSAVTRNGETVSLTSREFQLLWYLAEHRDQTITRDELLEQVWGQVPGTLTRTVDMHIASLRQKLETSPKHPEMILTVPGMGYRCQV